MKKLLALLVCLLMVLSVFGCAKEETPAGNTKIDSLSIQFVPSKDADVILTAAAPLADMLIAKLAEKGFDVGTVDISVGTSYAAVGEAMRSGTVDIGFIPASTYVLYAGDGAELLLVATRDAKMVETDNPMDYNTGTANGSGEGQATNYRSLFYVNIASEKGAALYAKVEAGEDLTWEDINAVTICSGSATSSASFVYPSLWLNTRFGKTLNDVTNIIPDGGYTDNMAKLVSDQCQITFGYNDVRSDVDTTAIWNDTYGMDGTVWDYIKVIAVGDPIMNDTISVSTASEKMTPELKTALQEAFMEIAQTEEGLATVAPYSHKGYIIGSDSDYDTTRAANALFSK
ncbi:MAG: PhnD/SsuA/transferrin family substrate-binding protein [Erysipelotrichaceae bacterium]|nr:PhnD/SsuA/transferrin family substrate-binding protein [Erysipelotrichaceae bacterium]